MKRYEGWSKAAPPYPRKERRDRSNNSKEADAFIRSFLASGDVCWCKEFEPAGGYRPERLAENVATQLFPVSRAYPVKVTRRGLTVYIELQASQ